jgi:hypothetical protein
LVRDVIDPLARAQAASRESTLSHAPALHASTNSSRFWWLLLVGMITTLLCAPFFRIIYGTGGDEGIFLHGAELMLQGKRLYADFLGILPPGSYVLTAAWFGMAGISIGSARTLAILTIVGIACFTFLACRQASKNALLSAILVSGWVMMSQWHWMQVSHHWFTTLFSMVAAWAALASLEQPQPQPRSLRWPVFAGAAAGAATMVMQTCGAWTTLAAITAFFNLRQNRAELAAYVFGVALMFAGVIAFLAEQHSLAAAFDDVVRFAGARYSSIQYVPFGNGASIFDLPLKCVFPLAALLVLFVSAYDWRACLHDRRLRLCAAFALAGFLGCFPRPDIAHIGFAAPLAFPLLALCATRLIQPLRPAYRFAIAAVMIGLCSPSAAAFTYIARTALHAQVVPTPRGEVAFLSTKDVAELLPRIAATPSQDAFFFYPYMPMLPFMVAREQVSKYDIFVPGYTAPAQYQDACLAAVRHASWFVIDRRGADYNFWKQSYPSMPDAEPQETIRFEEALDRASELVATEGIFELRRRREGASGDVCDAIAGVSSSRS